VVVQPRTTTRVHHDLTPIEAERLQPAFRTEPSWQCRGSSIAISPAELVSV
jgi:hypothetical protein